MDIKDIGTRARLPAGKASNLSGKAAVTNTGSAQQSATKVTLSETSQVTLAAGKGGGGPVFDAGKVEQIKSAIAKGQFQVDTSKVADGLLQSVKDLLG